MSKRSTFNKAVSAKARKSGVYSEVLGNWALVQAAYTEGKTPAATVKAIVAQIDPSEPAALAPAPREVAAADLPEDVTERPESTLSEKIALWVRKGNRTVPETDPMAFPFGHARVSVYVNGNSSAARALKANGFERLGTGCYTYAFFVSNGQSADAAFEKAAVCAKNLDRSLRLAGANAEVYATTVLT